MKTSRAVCRFPNVVFPNNMKIENKKTNAHSYTPKSNQDFIISAIKIRRKKIFEFRDCKQYFVVKLSVPIGQLLCVTSFANI